MTYTSYKGESILLIFSVYITDKIYFCQIHVKDCKDIVKDNSVKNYITNDVFDSYSNPNFSSLSLFFSVFIIYLQFFIIVSFILCFF